MRRSGQLNKHNIEERRESVTTHMSSSVSQVYSWSEMKIGTFIIPHNLMARVVLIIPLMDETEKQA